MTASPQVDRADHGRAAATMVHVNLTVVGRRAVMSVSGEIDLATAPVVADAVDDALDGGASELWLDFSSTTFMDSTGLHLLIDTQARMTALTRRLAVICPEGPVRRLLELGGLDKQLPLYRDRATAHRAA